jgi:hypothetical protein
MPGGLFRVDRSIISAGTLRNDEGELRSSEMASGEASLSPTAANADPMANDPPALAAYVDEMLDSDTLAVSSAARAIATELLAGAGTWRRAPFWYRALTASLLPERLRAGFTLPYGPVERRGASRALTLLRLVYPRIPPWLRYVAPYHEARGRLDGRRRPGPLTRLLNLLWIGRSSIAG